MVGIYRTVVFLVPAPLLRASLCFYALFAFLCLTHYYTCAYQRSNVACPQMSRYTRAGLASGTGGSANGISCLSFSCLVVISVL